MNILKKTMSVQRSANLAIALLAIALWVTSYCFQYGIGLQPCPLCLLQRYALIIVSVIFLLAMWHNPRRIGLRIYGGSGLLFLLAGTAAAARQIWLQHQSRNTPDSCIPGLDYLFKVLPTDKAMWVVFSSPASCGEVTWKFLNLSMAEWSLFFFVILILAAAWQIKQS